MKIAFKIFHSLVWLSIAYLSVEILLRRWWFDQLPTQVSAGWIYSLIIANGVGLYLLNPFKRLSKQDQLQQLFQR